MTLRPSRRLFLGGSAAVLAAPRLSLAQGANVLKFVPQTDVAVLDPVWTTTYPTRDHGYLVFDTLFGMDGQYRMQPQMLAGAVTESDGRVWNLTLRDGLKFHDGSAVLARDCVASIKRWGARDAFGQVLMAATDELSAPDDKTIRFRLKLAFPLLPDALGKASPNMCAIMPERLANTSPMERVNEMVGSGPYRFLAGERVPGALMAYAIWSMLGVIIASGVAMARPPSTAFLDRAAPPGEVSRQLVVERGDRDHNDERNDTREEDGVWEEVHETAVNLLYVLIALHIAGVAFETRRNGREILLAMLPRRA